MKRLPHPPFVTAVYEERRANEVVQAPPLVSCTGEEIPAKRFECDLCGKQIEGTPAGSGLLLWHRGDEMRVDEPPLCEKCASRITINAVVKWALEGEEEG